MKSLQSCTCCLLDTANHLIDAAAGYRGDGKSCVDIDECGEGTSGCDQTCVNEPGTYHCECAPGFNLVSPVLSLRRSFCSVPSLVLDGPAGALSAALHTR